MAASLLIVLAAAAAVSVHAEGRHGPGADGGLPMFGGSPEHMGRGLERMLDGLDATEAQRAQIRQIAMTAAGDLKTQRDAGRTLRERAMQIFTAPTVDANAAESVRQQMTAQADQVSKRMLQAMLEASNVLTPEQRAKLGQRMQERQSMMRDRVQRMQQDRAQRGAPPAPAK